MEIKPQYPAMAHRSVSLRMATSNASALAALDEQLANDLEARGNLAPTFYGFNDVGQNTWDAEYWIIYYHAEPAGWLCLDHNRVRGTVMLSLALLKQFRNRGIGGIAQALAVRYIFDVLGIRKMETEVLAYNPNSLKMNQGFMTLEGIRREATYWMGCYWDKHLFGLTRAEWQERRPRIDRILQPREKAQG